MQLSHDDIHSACDWQESAAFRSARARGYFEMAMQVKAEGGDVRDVNGYLSLAASYQSDAAWLYEGARRYMGVET